MKSINIAIACMGGLAAAAAAQVVDLTTYGSVHAKYVGSMGRSLDQADNLYSYWGDTIRLFDYNPSGIYDTASSGGNTNPGFRFNDNVTTGYTANTFGGRNPDYVGYRFKMPVQITAVYWWNYCYGDGGAFATTPALQYLDAPSGNWVTITAVSWDVPYNTDNTTGARNYQITVNPPISGAWGLRLYGDGSTSGPSPSVNDVDGFIGTRELRVYGELPVGGLDLNRNRALDVGAVAQSSTNNNVAVLNDGLYNGTADTWGSIGEDFMGITWPKAKFKIAAMGVVFKWWPDGGYFDECGNGFRIEYTRDGSSWTPVSNMDKTIYLRDWLDLSLVRPRWYLNQTWYDTNTANDWKADQGGDQAYLFRFDPVDGIVGLRIIGDPAGVAGSDLDGFVGAHELEVFGLPVTAEIVDFDNDSDVDANDLALFQKVLPDGPECALGPGIPVSAACQSRDLDKDGDVDQVDFAIFQRCFTGENGTLNPDCG